MWEKNLRLCLKLFSSTLSCVHCKHINRKVKGRYPLQKSPRAIKKTPANQQTNQPKPPTPPKKNQKNQTISFLCDCKQMRRHGDAEVIVRVTVRGVFLFPS